MAKDLYILTADADTEAFLRGLLPRHKALGIRPIQFDIQRHSGRDSGIRREGPEFVRAVVRKDSYDYVLLVWDRHGSGDDSLAATAAQIVESKLDSFTWREHSGAVVIDPELEEWVIHATNAVAKALGITKTALLELIEGRKLAYPGEKELLRSLFPRRPKQEHFNEFGKAASIHDLRRSPTFARFHETLISWFPASAS